MLLFDYRNRWQITCPGYQGAILYHADSNPALSHHHVLITAGCGGRQLAPAPQADRIAGRASAAQAQQNGVTMVLQSDHWEGTPSNLSVAVTPAHVQIQNASAAPLQIAYRQFHLETDSGSESAAMPPFKIEGSVTQTAISPLVSPAYAWNDFHIAPYYASFL